MVAKKEFFNNRLLVGVLVAFLFISFFQVEITGDAFKVKFPKQVQRYISTPQQKTATLTTPTQPAVVEKICVTNNDCSAGYSCKPVTKNICQKDVTTTVIPPTTTTQPAAPSCSDKIKNQDETAADCGGATCQACANGKACNNLDSNCASQYCKNNVCAQYVPIKLRLVSGTQCPLGFSSAFQSAGNKILVPKVPNPISLSDFTATTLAGGGVSGDWNWYVACKDASTYLIDLATFNSQTCGTVPNIGTKTVYAGAMESGIYDAKSSGVVARRIAPYATSSYCVNAPNDIPALIFKDVTTSGQVDNSKLGCPTGYTSSGILTEYSGKLTEYTANNVKYITGDQTKPEFNAFTHICEKR